jgi:hypothetical protein
LHLELYASNTIMAGGRKSGTLNYKNNILIAVVEEELPNGNLQLQKVAKRYDMELSVELQPPTKQC